MKICIVAPEHPNSHLHGGIARYLKDYIEELKQKVDVVLISIEDAKAIEGVKQYVIQSPPWGPLCSLIYASKINSLIEKIKPDVICLGYDQNSYTNNLEKELSSREISCRVVRLKSFKPDKYKSSKIKNLKNSIPNS